MNARFCRFEEERENGKLSSTSEEVAIMKIVLWLMALLGFVQAGAAQPSMVAGHVRLSDGQPVAGAQVALFDLTDLRRGPVARATTDVAGAFALPLAALGGSTLPDGFALGQNYPNPFNPSTIIPYQLPVAAHMRLELFNVLGQRVTTLVDGERPAGFHTAVWDATNAEGQAVGAGLYIYRLSGGGATLTRKMMLIDGQAGVAVPGGSGRPMGERPLGKDTPVYGLTVWGTGLAAHVDPAFAVKGGMAPVEVEVAAPAGAKRVAGSGLLGDVDGTGRVDGVDALLVALYCVDSSSLAASIANLALGDVNRDGQVDFVDAYLIGTYSTNPSDPVLPAGIGQKPTVSGDVPKMYWTDWGTQTIRRANLDGSQVEDLVSTGLYFSGLARPHSLALDVDGGKMYWADGNAAKIQRANLDGRQVETLVIGIDQNFRSPVTWDHPDSFGSLLTFGFGFRSSVEDNSMCPVGIALDVGGGKMYWTDECWDTISRANLDGSQVEILTRSVTRPVGIALDVGGGKMYWTDRGDTTKISRANLDGSRVETLVTGVELPHSLALDVGGGKMYWTDYGTDKIRRANLDGRQVEDLVTTGLETPTGLALDVGGGKMYWTDQGYHLLGAPGGRSGVKIQRANLDGSRVEPLVTTGLIRPFGFALDTSGSGSGDGATRLSLGSSHAGRIATGDAVNYFKVQVSEAGAGELTVYTTGSLNTKGTLENSEGDSLATDDDGGSGTNFRIERRYVTPGIYFVKVEGVGSNRGDYTIHVSFEAVDHSDTRSGATRLSLGSSRDGWIATGDDVDYFEVQVSEFGALTVYTTGIHTEHTLEDSSGAILQREVFSGRMFGIEHLVTPGTYYVKVEGWWRDTGDYTVHARFEAVDHSDTRSGATSLPLGGSRTGRIATRDDVDCFEVQVSEAGVLTVYTTGNLDTKGTLQNSAGSSLATDDDEGSGDNFRIERTVSAGTYYVKVEGVGSNRGDYTIHVSFEADDHSDTQPSSGGGGTADDHSDTRSGATSLPLGGSRPGVIATGDDVDCFEVQISETGVLTVYTTGSLDTKGTLENSAGSRLESDRNSGSGDNFLIQRTVSAGTYYVKVEGWFDTGDYTVHASFEADDHSDTRSGATSLSLGGSRTGRIATGDDVDYFEVQVSEAGVLTVYTTGSLDTRGTLENSAGSRLESDRNSGSGDNFLIQRTVSVGTYYVKVEGRFDTGDYTVHASFAADDHRSSSSSGGTVNDHSDTRSGATSLSLGGSRTGRIATGDDVDYFEVQVSEAGVLTVYTTGSLDTKGTLEDSAGSSLESDRNSGSGDNFLIQRTVSVGTYYVKVEGRFDTGDYTVHASFARGGG